VPQTLTQDLQEIASLWLEHVSVNWG
jgi:hypothetical protein